MTMEDPFAQAPVAAAAEPEQPPFTPDPEAAAPAATATVTQTKPAPAVVGADGKVVLTFKGGNDFSAPWIVIHADGLDEAAEFISVSNAPKLMDLMTRVQNAGAHFAGQAPAKPAGGGGGGQRSGGGAPAASQEATNGEERFCSHGKMTYRSGVSKAGKAYKMFACPERDRSQQCDPQWLR
ncbi:hypothetical protein SEA_LASTRESORT_53 [Gordonia phage LastResort]|uniref:ribonucleoside reductase class II n=1 Tax=Gordonia phage JSwag TaxID=1887649 RepID=UPI00084EEC5A|nr:ribonucleoside reductase class II [Gordonia phage JSwag]AXH47851.1 hypothetical protein SEA_LASTRESORT_53 [Gordonia phage LastResort]QDM56229.1 hypothetical protein SEA_REMO_53 [Gordonia phage ReMo]QLF84925.1 hypothetical protein SEA_EPSOCAMISIO_52 [Gordonia phage Epsocamisio]QZD98702.1 hypothetical protein SEA_LOOPER_54 [Gordonia phage Looper]UAJ15545.1 hypothetical protein SEA_BOOHOO_54 [Gordonia Phage Boohoo]UVD39800.1 hypothetical protein SEA_ANAYSIA_54 [Gordonia phage Anaysia]WKW8736